MEPPSSLHANDLKVEKQKVFDQIKPIEPDEMNAVLQEHLKAQAQFQSAAYIEHLLSEVKAALETSRQAQEAGSTRILRVSDEALGRAEDILDQYEPRYVPEHWKRQIEPLRQKLPPGCDSKPLRRSTSRMRTWRCCTSSMPSSAKREKVRLTVSSFSPR